MYDEEEKEKLGSIIFPVQSTYCNHWNLKNAQREIIQNWWDGLHTSQNLRGDQRKRVTIISSKNTLKKRQWKALLDDGKNIGHIIWDPVLKKIEVVNRDVQLEYGNILDFGYSTKRDSKELVGCHGDGLKIAIVEFTRKDKDIEIITNSVKWKFKFVDKKNNPELENLKGKFTKNTAMGPKKFNPAKDIKVSFKADNFDALDYLFLLKDSKQIDCSPTGYILQAEEFKGKIFVKGIYVKTMKNLILGYNFCDVDLNRDRLAMEYVEVLLNVAEVWENALGDHGSLLFDIVQKDSESIETRSLAYFTNSMAKRLLIIAKPNADHFLLKKNAETLEASKRSVLDAGIVPVLLEDSIYALFFKHQLIESLDDMLRRVFVGRMVPSNVNLDDYLISHFYVRQVFEFISPLLNITKDQIQWGTIDSKDHGHFQEGVYYLNDKLFKSSFVHSSLNAEDCFAKKGECCACCRQQILDALIKNLNQERQREIYGKFSLKGHQSEDPRIPVFASIDPTENGLSFTFKAPKQCKKEFLVSYRLNPSENWVEEKAHFRTSNHFANCQKHDLVDLENGCYDLRVGITICGQIHYSEEIKIATVCGPLAVKCQHDLDSNTARFTWDLCPCADSYQLIFGEEVVETKELGWTFPVPVEQTNTRMTYSVTCSLGRGTCPKDVIINDFISYQNVMDEDVSLTVVPMAGGDDSSDEGMAVDQSFNMETDTEVIAPSKRLPPKQLSPKQLPSKRPRIDLDDNERDSEIETEFELDNTVNQANSRIIGYKARDPNVTNQSTIEIPDTEEEYLSVMLPGGVENSFRIHYENVPEEHRSVIKRLFAQGSKKVAAKFNSLVQIKEIGPEEDHPCRGQNGVYATRNLKKNVNLGPYSGQLQISLKDDEEFVENDYLFKIYEDKEYIVSIDSEKFGNSTRYINDYRKIAPQNNAKFVITCDPTTGELRANLKLVTSVCEGDEILLDYGESYWHAKNPNLQKE